MTVHPRSRVSELNLSWPICSWLLTIVDIKRGYLLCRMFRIIIRKLSHCQHCRAIVLFVVAVASHLSFDDLVNSFGLTVGLWMEGCAHRSHSTQIFVKVGELSASEGTISI